MKQLTDREKAYRAWKDMCRRCEEQPAYTDCTVCDEWQDFEGFVDWYIGNCPGVNGFDLDKDILSVEEKIYSPATCAFVPRAINLLINVEKTKAGSFPIGVSINGDKFKAQIRVKSKMVYLGTFATIEDASAAYRAGKENHVKAMAYEFRHMITDKVFNALMKWSVNS